MRRHRILLGLFLAAMCPTPDSPAAGGGEEPPNPFGTVRRQRTDAIGGAVYLSNGKTIRGKVYLTRGHLLRIYDAQKQRVREVPLRVVKEIVCIVKKQWNEKEWRFKENANDKKVFTGRTYPARIYVHQIKLKRGDSITGPLAALVYLEPDPPAASKARVRPEKPRRFLLHKRDKGEPGTTLKELVYVKRIVLGQP
jgi:hypothetical protein